jgi:hypothetical protein
MAKRKRKRLQDLQYAQIISKCRQEAEEFAQKLGILTPSLEEIPYSQRMSAHNALIREDVDPSSHFSAPDFSQLKEQEKIVAYYARPDVQREMYRYAKGRYLTVLRNFKPMYPKLKAPEDVLPLMFHYLKPKGSRWPSMHGTILRYDERGKKVCDFVFEPDFKKSWSVAFGAARPIIRLFMSLGLPFFIKYSGNSSPHIIVPGEAFNTVGEKELNRKEFREAIYTFVKSRMHKPGLLDGSLWNPDHFLRLAYSIHELGGKVSMPIKPEEFDSFNPDMARIENVEVMENWWSIPEDAAERGRSFVQQALKNYPKLVSVGDKAKTEHKWEPPTVPRKIRRVFDDGWYMKVVTNGQNLLKSTESGIDRQSSPNSLGHAMSEALDMLKRWQDAGSKVDLKSAAEIFNADSAELESRWQRYQDAKETELEVSEGEMQSAEYYSRKDIQKVIYSYSAGRYFRVPESKSHFQLKNPSDIPDLSSFFESANPKWQGFHCTKATYSPLDNRIIGCDIMIEVDFSRSDYTSAIELTQILGIILGKYEVFSYVKFNGDESLEIIIPAEVLPARIDGQQTALQINQITVGLNRGFRLMPEVNGNDCILVIQPYGYIRPIYSLNPETGLSCAIFSYQELVDFSPENTTPDNTSVSDFWIDIPPHAQLQTQRFLKYILSRNWEPFVNEI